MEPVFHSIGVSRLRIGVDGEGVTTLAAGYGCPLRCRYCLNPQCFRNAKPLRTYTVQELLREVSIDDLYFQATGGGIVFGGGEPLLYADFIHAFRQACPAEWKISLESSLAVDREELEKVISDIDFFLIDIKDMDPEIYLAYTGRDNQKLQCNLEYLARMTDPEHICIRIPLIEGFNTEKDRERSRDTLRNMGFTKFDLFRYDTGRGKEKYGDRSDIGKDECGSQRLR